jgi:preprotein translocase subunit SecD
LINKSKNFSLRLRDDVRNHEQLAELKNAAFQVSTQGEGDIEEVTQVTLTFEKDADYKVFSSKVTGFLNKYYPEYQWLADDDAKKSVTVGMRRAAIESFQEEALDQAIETIERRINAFGVAESSVSRRDNDKIVVELPGLGEEEFGKAKEKLAQTGLLHFKIVEYDQAKSQAFFSKVRARKPSTDAWPSELSKVSPDHKVYVSGSVIRSTSREILEYMVGDSLDGDLDHIVGFEKTFADPQDGDLSEIRCFSAAQEKAIDRE